MSHIHEEEMSSQATLGAMPKVMSTRWPWTMWFVEEEREGRLGSRRKGIEMGCQQGGKRFARERSCNQH